MGTGMFFKKYCKLAGIFIAMSVNAFAAGLGPSIDTAFTASADGTTQRYVLRLPSAFDSSEHHDLLITLHGHGQDRWEYATETRDDCKAVQDFAGSREMILVCPDYRANTSWMGPLAEQDVVQIIEGFKNNYLINRVFICGGSMGGSSALTFTVLQPAMVDGVMAMNPTANHLEFNNFQDAISRSFGGNKKEIPGEYKKRSAEYWPEKIVVSVGITTGGLDSLVPPDSALRLADVLNKIGRKVKSIHRETTGHATNYADAISIFTFVVDNALKFDPAKLEKINGWSKIIEAPENTAYYSFMGQMPMGFVRQTDGKAPLRWLTTPAPDDVKKTDRFVFRFLAITGYESEPASGKFSLYLSDPKKPQDKPTHLLDFDHTLKSAKWSGMAGWANLNYEVIGNRAGEDSSGIMELSLPTSLLIPGKPVELKVIGSPSNSKRYFGIYQYP